MIPEEHRAVVISNGIHFMRSITEAYGADEGLRLWETIANTLDPDVKGQIFIAMLTGNYNDRIGINGISMSANAVSCIKELRSWTGLGLKEAKDIFDRLKDGTLQGNVKKEYITVKPEEHHRAIVRLRSVGFLT